MPETLPRMPSHRLISAPSSGVTHQPGFNPKFPSYRRIGCPDEERRNPELCPWSSFLTSALDLAPQSFGLSTAHRPQHRLRPTPLPSFASLTPTARNPRFQMAISYSTPATLQNGARSGNCGAQLTWLAQQLHKYKVIAGNHDLLLDPDFQRHHPERWQQVLGSAIASREDRPKVADGLDWGSIAYVQNTSTSLTFGNDGRTINIFGSPLTPQYGLSAFQYLGGNDV